MAQKKSATTPDGLRILSDRIYAFWDEARLIALDILVRSHREQSAPRELLETINRQLAAAKSIWKREKILFYFERSYSATHDELELLDGKYTSYHDRALKLSHSFLLRLLSHEWDMLPAPECMNYVPPKTLAELNLEVAAYIVGLFKAELLDKDYLEELTAETSAAANLLAAMTGPIPAEFRTKVLSKKKAAALLGRPNPDSGVRWLNACIEKGVIRCQQLSRQAFVFDVRDFPAHRREQIRPTK